MKKKFRKIIKSLMSMTDPTAFMLVLISICLLCYLAGWNKVTPKKMLESGIELFLEEAETPEEETVKRHAKKSMDIEEVEDERAD